MNLFEFFFLEFAKKKTCYVRSVIKTFVLTKLELLISAMPVYKVMLYQSSNNNNGKIFNHLSRKEGFLENLLTLTSSFKLRIQWFQFTGPVFLHPILVLLNL